MESQFCWNSDARCNGIEQSEYGIILVPGAGGGFESPAHDLYGFLATRMQEHGICTLQLRHPHPAQLDPCVHDVVAAATCMRQRGIKRLALVGWSFGGAVVLQAAAQIPEAVAVVTVATQSFGTDAVANLPEDCWLLLLHGSADDVLPPDCSMHVYQKASDRKELLLYPDAGHALTEVSYQVHQTVYQWLFRKLRPQPATSRVEQRAVKYNQTAYGATAS